ncbi:efflux RND transporter periplasmic adaptor subunit [Hyphomicrobium sp. CS1BSMeth3]|uniref:efflux RND transporter periplasmic adaptor subunit n=1 Tax=Hyphomicrobium sp. CS1BSMeth3 TaxID=1892844 RepID=UPI0009FA3C5B|nr:efflux RND transporter periplasmic adaptor subunit [Hyphomicrobium sp. CS1BSMeth3]
MKKKLLLWGLVVVLAGAGAFTYKAGLLPSLAAEKKTQPAPDATPKLQASVSVVRVAPHAFIETLALSGSLIPREEILIGPEIESLRVLDVLVEEGAAVKRGQVLARLVPDTLDAQLAQNEAALARNAAATAQARSTISEAEARLKEAQNAIARARTLKESGHVSEAVFDQRESLFKLAEAQLFAARDGLKASEADRASIEAQRRELLWRRSKTEVTAPADGVISHRRARIGASAALVSQEPMFRMVANGQIELDAEVPQAHLVRLAPGQKARIAIPGNGEVDGTVRLVSPAVDPTTRLGRVRILLGNDPNLRVGTFARGEVVIAHGSGLAVPRSAVLFTKSGPSVQVVENETIETRPVTLGLAEADKLEIRSGVTEGTLVVAKSGTFLRHGDRVRPVVLPRAIADGR